MLQRLLCVHLCFRNLTIAILYCLVLHNTSSIHFRMFKIQLLGLLLECQIWTYLTPPAFPSLATCTKRIKHKVCSICYTTLTGASPKYMSELVNVYIPSRCLRSSSDSRTFTIPCVRTKTCGQRSFAYQGPVTWNELPFDLRHKDSLFTFKRALKTHLFHHLT